MRPISLKTTELRDPTPMNHQELDPPLLLALLGLCLGISDWIGLQFIYTSVFSMLITPQLYGIGMGLIIGLAIFNTFFRKKRTRTELLLVTRVIFRSLLLLLFFATILSVTRKYAPELFLFILGAGLGVISGILTILVFLWYFLSNSSVAQ